MIREHIARVDIERVNGCYGVVVTFADGTVREVGSSEWTTLGGALERVAGLISSVLHERRGADDPRCEVP